MEGSQTDPGINYRVLEELFRVIAERFVLFHTVVEVLFLLLLPPPLLTFSL